MKNNESIDKEIRNTWFNNHQAEWHEGDLTSTLHWKEQGTMMYAVTYLFSQNNLIVTGDLGDAIFSFSEKINLMSFKDMKLDYLMKKLSCSSSNRWKFNQQTAQTQLHEWLNEHLQTAFSDDIEIERRNDAYRELYGNLLTSIDDITSTDSFDFNVWIHYQDSSIDMEMENWEEIATFGRELPHHFYAYLIGLKMAIAQIEK